MTAQSITSLTLLLVRLDTTIHGHLSLDSCGGGRA